MTTDVDFLTVWDPRMPHELERLGFNLRISADEGEPHLIQAHGPRGNVDLILAGTEYQREAIARAVDHVITREDVLIHKLIAWRLRDKDDIRAILEAGGPIDLDYMRRWARVWDVEDRWAEAQTWS